MVFLKITRLFDVRLFDLFAIYVFLFLKSPPPRVNGPGCRCCSSDGGGGIERGSWGCDGAERQTETATADAAGAGAAGQQNANTQVRK